MNSCIIFEIILPSAQIGRGEEDQAGRQQYTHTHIAENTNFSIWKIYEGN
jgi:hypothetical protein